MANLLTAVAVLGTPGGCSFASLGVDAALDASWHNTGNYLFQLAVAQTIATPKMFVSLKQAPEVFRNSIAALVIPAANLINADWDLTPWAEFVERTDKATIVVGLGAQATLGGDTKIELKAGTERFLRVIAERSILIGVRGPFTQHVLSDMGILNTVVIGCPSNFLNMRLRGREVQSKIEGLRDGKPKRIAYLIGMLEREFSAERALFEFARSNNADAIIQTHSEFFKLLRGVPLDDEEFVRLSRNAEAMANPLRGRFLTRANRFITYVKEKGCHFSDAQSWIDSMHVYDLVLGQRIHGAIAATLGNSLGVCVAHDARTLELAEVMGFPHVTLEALDEPLSCRSLSRNIRFDAKFFDDRRTELLGRYQSLLTNAGLLSAVVV